MGGVVKRDCKCAISIRDPFTTQHRAKKPDP